MILRSHRGAHAGVTMVTRDRGSVIIEFVLILPIVAMLALGALEYGGAWSDTGTVERGVHAAARVGSNVSRNRYADYEILRAIDTQIAAADRATIRRVIVFRSTTGDGKVPDECKAIDPMGTGTFGVSGVCNVYSAVQVGTASSSVGFPSPTSCAGAWDANWCPLSRVNTGASPQFLGVWVEVDYERQTNIVSASTRIERQAVFQLEPPTIGG